MVKNREFLISHVKIFIFLLIGIISVAESDAKIKKISDNDMVVVIALDKTDYRPEEPIKARLQVQNLTNEKLLIPSIDAKTVTFYKTNTNAANDSLAVIPVYSPKEELVKLQELEPKKWMIRDFVFTNCTQTTGTFALSAIYNSYGVEPTKGRPQFISPGYDFIVSGQSQYHRDLKGILLKEDAIDIAVKRLDIPYKSVRADLIINEAGFYDWWITFNINTNGKEERKAFLINPYLCVVRKEAQPYDPPQKKKAPIPSIDSLKEKNKENPKPIENQNK